MNGYVLASISIVLSVDRSRLVWRTLLVLVFLTLSIHGVPPQTCCDGLLRRALTRIVRTDYVLTLLNRYSRDIQKFFISVVGLVLSVVFQV